MFGFGKLWNIKPKRLNIGGNVRIPVFMPDAVRQQQMRVADYLIDRAEWLEKLARELREEARKME